MVSDSYTGVRILAEAGNVFINSVFHSEDVHKYFVLPLSVFYLIYKNLYYFRKRQCKKIYKDPINLIFLLIIMETLAWFLVVASLFALPGMRRGYQRMAKWIDGIAGTLFAGFGIHLIISR